MLGTKVSYHKRMKMYKVMSKRHYIKSHFFVSCVVLCTLCSELCSESIVALSCIHPHYNNIFLMYQLGGLEIWSSQSLQQDVTLTLLLKAAFYHRYQTKPVILYQVITSLLLCGFITRDQAVAHFSHCCREHFQFGRIYST